MKKATLNPWFNAVFSLPLDGDEFASTEPVMRGEPAPVERDESGAVVDNGPQLRVLVEDWDQLSANDFLGEVTIPLAHLATKSRQLGWWALKPKPKKRKASGSAGSRSASKDAKAAAADDAEDEADAGRGRVQLVLRWVYNELLDHFVGPDEDPRPDMPPNELRVALIQGRNLLAMDTKLLGGAATSDPLVTMRCAAARRKSSVRKTTLRPYWNEVFAFPVEDATQTLEVVVDDWDLLSGNDFMGRVPIKVGQFADRQRHKQWYKLRGNAKPGASSPSRGGGGGSPGGGEPEEGGEATAKDRGEVQLMTRWVYNPELDHFADDDGRPDMAPNQLNVALVQGRQLPAMDRKLFGGGMTSDPLAKFTCGSQRGKTKAVKGTCDPWWNEVFRLPIDADTAPPTLELIVEDWDLLSGNDFMGRVEIALAPLLDKERIVNWYPLQPKPSKRKSKRRVRDEDGPASPGSALSPGSAAGGITPGGASAVGFFAEEGEEEPLGAIQVVARWVYNPELDHFADDDGFPDKVSARPAAGGNVSTPHFPFPDAASSLLSRTFPLADDGDGPCPRPNTAAERAARRARAGPRPAREGHEPLLGEHVRPGRTLELPRPAREVARRQGHVYAVVEPDVLAPDRV